MGESEAERGDRLAPGGIAAIGGQQFQLGERCVGEPGPDPLLLNEDRLSGILADRQPPLRAIGLVVVVDEHGTPVGVAGWDRMRHLRLMGIGDQICDQDAMSCGDTRRQW
jgi:hypothetical protein